MVLNKKPSIFTAKGKHIARQAIALARKQSINFNFGADTVLISTDLYISLAH